jgi:hypothetical protein
MRLAACHIYFGCSAALAPHGCHGHITGPRRMRPAVDCRHFRVVNKQSQWMASLELRASAFAQSTVTSISYMGNWEHVIFSHPPNEKLLTDRCKKIGQQDN